MVSVWRASKVEAEADDENDENCKVEDESNTNTDQAGRICVQVLVVQYLEALLSVKVLRAAWKKLVACNGNPGHAWKLLAGGSGFKEEGFKLKNSAMLCFAHPG